MSTDDGDLTGAANESVWRTLRRGLALSPQLYAGMAGTLGLAIVMTLGRGAVPVAIQLGIDHGLRVPGGPDMGVVTTVALSAAGVLLLTNFSGYLMMRRLFIASETALALVRTRVFRHIHDLSLLHQQEQQRGGLVSRVTSDVDQITGFLQWGGVILLISIGQTLVATAVMVTYSWQLALVVLTAFAPTVLVVSACQRRLLRATRDSRERIATVFSMVAESVVGAPVIRAYGVSQRTAGRIDGAIEEFRRTQQRALQATVTAYSYGELATGLALAAVVSVGAVLGVGGSLSVGQITAFLFLVTLFVLPAQAASEQLNDAQSALAGWRRVLDVLDLAPQVADPGAAGVDLPAGPPDIACVGVCFGYPGGPRVLHDIDLEIAAKSRVAVVGETGSGKTTLAKLITRLVDPDSGQILLAGAPLDTIRFASLRRRVMLVPQEGFLFDGTIADNVRFGRPELTAEQLQGAFTDLGLADWVSRLPLGVDTRVGERGEELSVGERQLIALVRAHVANPELLVLDEATSAVDPGTEVALHRAFTTASQGRTTVVIAHRLSTAQSADEVVVVDAGRIVQRGHHDQLVADADSVYGRLYTFWLEQTE